MQQGYQARWVNWFFQHSDRPDRRGQLYRDFRQVRSKEDYLGIRVLCDDFLSSVKSIHTRHAHIHQYDVVFPFSSLGDRLRPVRSFGYLETTVL